jgi:WNK lysine deficient protein kinase
VRSVRVVGGARGGNGAGCSFRAVDKDTMFEVAWHEISIDPSQSGTGLGDDVPTIEHHHLLRVFARWEDVNDEKEPILVVITDIMDAGTLESRVAQIKHDIRTRVVKKWCRQILEGLAFLHEKARRVSCTKGAPWLQRSLLRRRPTET